MSPLDVVMADCKAQLLARKSFNFLGLVHRSDGFISWVRRQTYSRYWCEWWNRIDNCEIFPCRWRQGMTLSLRHKYYLSKYWNSLLSTRIFLADEALLLLSYLSNISKTEPIIFLVFNTSNFSVFRSPCTIDLSKLRSVNYIRNFLVRSVIFMQTLRMRRRLLLVVPRLSQSRIMISLMYLPYLKFDEDLDQ